MLGWGRRAAPSGPGRRQGEAPCNSLVYLCRVVPSTVARLQEQVLAVRQSVVVEGLSQREGREWW